MANSDGIPGPATGQGLGAGLVNIRSSSYSHTHIILIDTTILHILAVSFFVFLSYSKNVWCCNFVHYDNCFKNT